MDITLSIDNLTTEDALSCDIYEIRRAYVILSRDGVVTAQTLSEAQNEILKESVEFFEVQTDVDCNELLKTLHRADVQSMFRDIYKEHIEYEARHRDGEIFMKTGKTEFPVLPTEPDHEPSDGHEASLMLAEIFSDICPPEIEYQPPVDPKEIEAIEF
ncbi:hypothetical protein [Solidesulfovibrio carbinolicus]|uniref:Uncharacterized protein n=1 Tax=Solidesulfovibrio carbinolicus TaxID=296842 RepID=A0A4P6HK21_9BACT|nr:hypothetical protein [Solidesulfovibrio carbinolicus]QAZ67467.1 hypothetical protein C3Y92_09620 [Solidesulfovibrio carbinolicus]